ncbi:unnamed protein product [Heligmosomoides polygyrus]|uniref:EF-hand domain-containing protein n=1 Tax=Heligmosomoides polygyrus TaxID=6339 RepID=A0A3P7Z894_HELPZ|nr:unnamed protein product [Heligmosomoides polygyrus]
MQFLQDIGSRVGSPKPYEHFRQFGSRAPTDNKFLRSVYWALRGCQYWLCFYDDEIEVDIEDLLSNPFNTQPPSLDHLQQLTGFDRRWLMFMYRNFKQKCSNGRMMLSEWRSIFRLLFPYAANHQFADRLYTAISSVHDHPHITFEDLVICLWELTEGANYSDYNQPPQSGTSVKAEFVFGLMCPDAKGRVDEAAFHAYVHSVFNLCGSKKDADESVTLGLPPGSLHHRAPASDTQPLSPTIRKLATERFRVRLCRRLNALNTLYLFGCSTSSWRYFYALVVVALQPITLRASLCNKY